MSQLVTVTVSFEVDDAVTAEQVDYIVGTIGAQVDGEGLVGYTEDSLNELLVDVKNTEVAFEIERF